ncbi:hypothetical protein FS749_003186 [Ceratobasidium sp. UAMH 11750]|nr:hypothetical protein FS749_003186 [Ceratobasidium sp. UAMH 11750]
MPKAELPFQCRFCEKPCKTPAGLERHFARKRECGAARAKEREHHVERQLTSARPRTVAGDRTSHTASIPTAPSNAENAVEPGSQLGEQPENDGPLPRCTPRVTVEDVEDADAQAGPSGHPRSPSVILEEVQDQDMARPPRWGPHPRAKPTRPSLFPRPHPDPTAGEPLRVYPADRQVPPLYTSLLAEPDVFREAYWLDNLPICRDDEEEYFRFAHNGDWHWRNVSELDKEILHLPRGPRWFRETMFVEGDQGVEVLDLWRRDIRDIVRWLLGNRRFLRHTRYAPEQQYDSATMENRVYGEGWSGDWWWRMQNILGPYATVAPIIISTDKTKMTVFSGNQKAWPVYMSLANISSDIRRRPSERATVLIGFIPVSELTNISNTEERSRRRWQLFHSSLESIFEPLKEVSRTGMEVLCSDGGVRRVYPILAAYIADFPEQATIACVQDSRCPICWVPAKERGDLSKRYPMRDRRRTLDALDDHWKGYSRTIDTLGIRPTRPFWRDLPHVNIAGCLTPDVLHQLHKGVLGDHLVNWCTILLGQNEMNRRTKGMPRFQGLRHFAQGTSVISLWTGKEAKALASTFLSIVAGYEDPKVVYAVRSIVDFTYRAQLPEISERDIQAMEEDLRIFDRCKGAFVDPDVRGLPRHQDHFNKIPKIHMPTHYPFLIRELGATIGYSTEITERLHIECVKEPWRATNHNNPIPQMIQYLEKKEAWAYLRSYLHDTGLVIDKRFASVDDDDDDDDEQGPEDIVEGRRNGDDGDHRTWLPTPSISIAKRPALGRQRGTYLINTHKASNLIPATVKYLHRISPRASIALFEDSYFKVWKRCKLQHKRLPFYPALAPLTNSVRAFPPTTDEEGRLIRQGFFDVVLFSPTANNAVANSDGLHRLQAGRVRAIFELPNHLQTLCPEKLVYIEHFQPFSARPSRTTDLHTTKHAISGGHRCTSVIPLSHIRMTCHLAPKYHLFDRDHLISAATDLLAVHDSFYLNKYASFWLFLVLEYWERQRRLNDQACFTTLDPRTIFLPCSISYLQLQTESPLPAINTVLPLALASLSPLPDMDFASCTLVDTAQMRHVPYPPSHSIQASTLRAHSVRGRRMATTTSSSLNLLLNPMDGVPPRPVPVIGPLSIASLSHMPPPHQIPGCGLFVAPDSHSDGLSNPNLTTESSQVYVPGIDSQPGEDARSDTKESRSQLGTQNESLGMVFDGEMRRQHIVESERRRRNDMRECFARLKDVLPASAEKCSKIGLLERATSHVRDLQNTLRQAQDKLIAYEVEVTRLRRMILPLAASVTDAVDHHRVHRPSIVPRHSAGFRPQRQEVIGDRHDHLRLPIISTLVHGSRQSLRVRTRPPTPACGSSSVRRPHASWFACSPPPRRRRRADEQLAAYERHNLRSIAGLTQIVASHVFAKTTRRQVGPFVRHARTHLCPGCRYFQHVLSLQREHGDVWSALGHSRIVVCVFTGPQAL